MEASSQSLDGDEAWNADSVRHIRGAANGLMVSLRQVGSMDGMLALKDPAALNAENTA